MERGAKLQEIAVKVETKELKGAETERKMQKRVDSYRGLHPTTKSVV